MSRQRPYTFPHKSRAAITDYLCKLAERRRYVDHYDRFPFSWNMKARNVDVYQPLECAETPISRETELACERLERQTSD